MNSETTQLINDQKLIDNTLTRDLMTLVQQYATGELVIQYKNDVVPPWKLYFYMGRIVYATGGRHSVRRWFRALKQHCPAVITGGWLNHATATEHPWEVDLLNQMVSENLIAAVQAKLIIQSIVQEVMFTLLEQPFITSQWHPNVTIAQNSAFLSVEQVIVEVRKMLTGWRGSELGILQDWMTQFSPDLAPMLKRPANLPETATSETVQGILRLLQGQLTLWDISLHMQRPVADVMRVLMPFIRRGIIELRPIPDVSVPCTIVAKTTAPTPTTQRGLIACIDDSPVIGQIMESILRPQGYEVMSILNPLQGISILLERKPDLIFLDLIMPHTNGYELCTFLRKTTAFQETPIIILTGNDGVVDRVRAKIAGASAFLGKPPEPQTVIKTVQKHFGGVPGATHSMAVI